MASKIDLRVFLYSLIGDDNTVLRSVHTCAELNIYYLSEGQSLRL